MGFREKSKFYIGLLISLTSYLDSQFYIISKKKKDEERTEVLTKLNKCLDFKPVHFIFPH